MLPPLVRYSFYAERAPQTDYRDDASAISAVATLRAMDFGDNSIRKVVGDVLIHYRVTPGVDSNVTVASAADLEGGV